jgi:hypothetical protein
MPPLSLGRLHAVSDCLVEGAWARGILSTPVQLHIIIVTQDYHS